MEKHAIKYINSQTINVMLPDGINVRIDPVADVIYIKIREAKIERSREEKDGVLLDLDKHGGLIGMSIVHPKKISIERRKVFKRVASRYCMPEIERIHPDHLARSYDYAASA